MDGIAVAAAGMSVGKYEGVDENLMWHNAHHDLSQLPAATAMELDRLRG